MLHDSLQNIDNLIIHLLDTHECVFLVFRLLVSLLSQYVIKLIDIVVVELVW